jgi:hypothetical protein
MMLSGRNPDVMVLFVAGIEMVDMELRKDPQREVPMLQNVPKGSLLVVLIDSTSRVPVWVGVAGAEIGRQQKPSAARQRLEYAISRMFRQFPE